MDIVGRLSVPHGCGLVGHIKCTYISPTAVITWTRTYHTNGRTSKHTWPTQLPRIDICVRSIQTLPRRVASNKLRQKVNTSPLPNEAMAAITISIPKSTRIGWASPSSAFTCSCFVILLCLNIPVRRDQQRFQSKIYHSVTTNAQKPCLHVKYTMVTPFHELMSVHMPTYPFNFVHLARGAKSGLLPVDFDKQNPDQKWLNNLQFNYNMSGVCFCRFSWKRRNDANNPAGWFTWHT